MSSPCLKNLQKSFPCSWKTAILTAIPPAPALTLLTGCYKEKDGFSLLTPLLTLYIWLAQTPQVKSSDPQDSPSPISDANHKSRPPILLTNQLEIRGSHDTLLKIGNFLEWLAELRKALFTYHYPLIMKDTTQKQPNGKDALGKGMWKGAKSFHTLSGHTTLPASQHVHQLKLSAPHSSGIFREASSHRHVINILKRK